MIDNNRLIYYHNGVIDKIKPAILEERDLNEAVRSTIHIVVDGICINLLDADDIIKINIPEVAPDVCTSFRLDCNLHSQAVSIRNAGYLNEAVLIQTICFKSFMRAVMNNTCFYFNPWYLFILPQWLYEDERDEEAEKICYAIRQVLDFRAENKKKYEMEEKRKTALLTLERAADIESDLVEVPYQRCCCDICAKYRGRLYSISGNDKRFPKLPDLYYKYGGFHKGCTCYAMPASECYIHLYAKNDEGTQEPVDIYDEEAIAHSNRPFVDDRTDEEIKIYNDYSARKQREELAGLHLGFEEKVRRNGRRGRYYHLLKQNFPELAPKNIGAFTRMKNSRTKRYINIVSRMSEIGIFVDF